MTVRQPIEEEYLDVFQNIEASIVAVYRETPELTNWDVESALDALIRQYQAEWRGKEVRPPRLSTEEKLEVFDLMKNMCEWRLGRTAMQTDAGEIRQFGNQVISLEEIVAILKRIRKSVRYWHKKAGRRGYLEYIDQFLP